MEILEGLDLRAGIAIAVGTLIAAATAWMRIRRGWLSISIRRTDRLYRLVSTRKWRNVDGAALQLAVEQAFGIHLDDREIRYALERHDSIGLLRDRVRSAHLVHWDSDLPGYRDDRIIKPIPIVFWRRLYGSLLAVSFPFLVAFTLWAAQSSLIVAAIAFVEAVLLMWMLRSSYREIGAAEKLLHEKHLVVAQSETDRLPMAGRRRRTRPEAAKSV